MQKTTKIWTIGTLLKWTQDYFASKNIESARIDAEILLAYLLQKERIYLYVHFDEPLQEEELTAFRELVKKRALREPVAYIIGKKEFMGMTFIVNKNVLVPRPETEHLVEAVSERLPTNKNNVIADIGTGSGAIAISLAKMCPDIKVYAVDISEQALIVARENASVLQADNIEFCQGDLLTPLSGLEKNSLQAIVSNPPYIPQSDMADLEPDVREYEPHNALTDDNDGFDFYRRLLGESQALLREDGFLACEIGIGQAEEIKKIAQQNNWGSCEIIKDLANIERVMILWKQK